MNIDDQAISSIAGDIWGSMLGIELDGDADPEVLDEGPNITAVIRITGDWDGAVTLRCSAALAQCFAATMFAIDVDELSAEEIRDAFGELGNMTAGSIKGLLEGTCELGIPAVAEEFAPAVLPASNAVAAVVLGYAGHPLEVMVFEAA